MKEGRARNIIVVTGAGLSTSAGIPDFRSENGLYATLGKYGVDPTQLDHPTQVWVCAWSRGVVLRFGIGFSTAPPYASSCLCAVRLLAMEASRPRGP